jgi:hypothetical protein
MGALLMPSSSGATTLVVKLGNSLTSVSVKPVAATGTLTFSANTISAKCSQSALAGSAGVKPICTTRTIVCPTTAMSCDLQIAPARQASLNGRPDWAGSLDISGAGYTGFTVPQPYQCSATVCQQQVNFTGFSPGDTVSATIYNIASGTSLPSIGVALVLTVH